MFGQDAGTGSGQDQRQGAPAEQEHALERDGQQRIDHVAHDDVHRTRRVDVRAKCGLL